MRKTIPLSIAFFLAATACTSDDPNSASSTTVRQNDVVLVSANIASFDRCDSLLDAIKSEAMLHVGPYGFDDGYGYPRAFEIEGDMALAESDSATDTESTAPAADGGKSYSETNNQEAGVDEPDVVKTDGNIIVAFDSNDRRSLLITDSNLADTRRVDLPEETYGQNFFLQDGKIFVMANRSIEEERSDGDLASKDFGYYNNYWRQEAVIYEIDVDTLESVMVAGFTDSSFNSARMTDGTVRVVLQSAPSDRLPFVYPAGANGEETAEKFNRFVIEDSTIEDWLPQQVDNEGNTSPLTDCSRFYIPNKPDGFGIVTAVTFNVSDDGFEKTDAASILSDSGIIYASTDNLVVATNNWRWNEKDQTTQIHVFNTTNTARTDYVASGEIEGYLSWSAGQFTMSEYQGVLRIVATNDSRNQADTESRIVTLKADGDSLVKIGEVGNIGKGEEVQSVRFVQDKAYVVTFRQTDPFYIVDLSDPSNPEVKGELKILGFSSYLHQLDDETIMGVGFDADEEGRTKGLQLSTFDTANPYDPTRIDTFGYGQDSYSEAAYNHLSFLWWDQDRIAVIPVQKTGDQQICSTYNMEVYDEETETYELIPTEDCYNSGWIQGVSVMKVSEDGLFTEEAFIEKDETVKRCYSYDVYYSELDGESELAQECYDETWAPYRTLVIDNEMFVLSNTGIDSFSLTDYASTGSVNFSDIQD